MSNLKAIRLQIYVLWQLFTSVRKKKNNNNKKKKKKEMKKMGNFLKADISGMACTIYFKSGLYSPLICWHLQSEFGFVCTKDYGTANGHKIMQHSPF